MPLLILIACVSLVCYTAVLCVVTQRGRHKEDSCVADQRFLYCFLTLETVSTVNCL